MTDLTVSHEYNGAIVPQRISDEYVDVTALCQSEGKALADYMRLKSTKTYLEALSSNMGITILDLISVSQGNGSRTYAHPEVAIDIAKWVSVKCRIWANRTLVGAIKGQELQTTNQKDGPSPKLIQQVAEVYARFYGDAYAQSYIGQQIEKHYPALAGEPLPAKERSSLKSSNALLNATEVAEQLGMTYKSSGKPNPRAVNNMLAALGYQEKIEGKWSATEKGKPFSDRKPVSTGSKSDKDQLLWYASILDELRGSDVQEAA